MLYRRNTQKSIYLGIAIGVLLFFHVPTVVTGQTPASAFWQLSSNQNAVVTGYIVAPSQRLVMMQETYSGGVQRTSPVGVAGTWPAETSENPNRFIEFAIAPLDGYSLTVSSISMILYVNSGSGMRANVYYSKDSSFTSRTQIGSTLTLSSTAPSSPNITATLSVELKYRETLFVRIYPWYTSATTGKYVIVNSVTIAGTTLPSTGLLVSRQELTGFLQVSDGQPSESFSYTITGINLTNDVLVTPPEGFEISSDGGTTWLNTPVTLPVTNGVIEGQPKPLFVRMNAVGAGVHSGNILHTTEGISPVYVSVEGVILSQEPTQISTLRIEAITGTTVTLSFPGGNGTHRCVAICTGNEIPWKPTDGVPIIGVNAHFVDALDQGSGVKIIFNGEDTVVTVTGLTSNTTYTAAVFEYNVATGNSQNYLTSEFSTVTFTTPKVASFSVVPSLLNFGSVLIGTSSTKSFTLMGWYLSENAYITLSAPEAFQLSLTEDGIYTSTVQIPYTGDALPQTRIFVRFQPSERKHYSNTLTISGGGTSAQLNILGDGVTTLVQTDEPVGFAARGGVTGGKGGTSVIITDPAELANLMKAREGKSTTPLIVYISGTLSGYSTEISVKRTANISILGIGNNAGFNGFGMKVVECNNIIIRNLTFADCRVDEKDALAIDASTNVWVDHCTFTDSPAYDPSGSSHDGQLDVKNGSYNVTISYNHFMNHRKTCLLGHTSSQTSDTVMKVTYYRNWFDGTYSRHPRIRYAKAHIVNNLYSNVGGYGVGVTCDAQVYLEANYFENTPYPVLISQINDSEGTLSGDPAGYIKAVDNITVNSGAVVENLSKYSFYPAEYYSYDAVPATEVKSLVQENAGVGKITIVTEVCEENRTSLLPSSILLYQNYPNPFNPSTRLTFAVPRTMSVTLKVYDGIGRVLATLYHGVAEAQKLHEVVFDASTLPSGVYFGVLEAEGQRSIRKMMLVK